MPRNGSGTQTTPNTFVAGTSITAADHNENWTDSAAEITNSLALDGQSTMTGQLKAANGTEALPGITFGSDPDVGLFRIGANNLGFSLGGVKYGDWSTTTLTIATGLTVSAGAVSLPAGAVAGTALADAGVTYAKIQNVSASSRLLGRATSGAGVTEEITIGSGLSLSGSSLISAFAPPASFKNLSIKVATNTTVTVAADFVVTTDGSSYQTTAVSSTVNLATTGADALDAGSIAIDTWYYIWVIAKADGTTKCLASTSSTAPTMPSGYTYKARIGAVQTIHGSATLYGTWQFGRRAQYVVGLAQTATRFLVASSASSAVGNMTVGASLVAVQVTGNAKAAPATASVVFGSIFGKDGSTTNIVAAPNNNFGANTSVTNPPPCVLNAAGNGTSLSVPLNFLLESNSIYWACNSMTIAAIAIDGWEDNI